MKRGLTQRHEGTKLRGSRTFVPLCLCVSILLLASMAHAQKDIADQILDKNTGTRIELRSVFDPLPPTGFVPVRMVATNGTGSETIWRLSFESETQNYRNQNRHSSRFALSVPARSTQSATLLVPLAVGYGDTSSHWGSGHQLRVSLDVGGIGRRDFFDHDNRVNAFPAIALSKALADTNHSRLQDEVEQRMKSSSTSRSGPTKVFGSVFDPDDLPEDWRGLSGFDVMMISSTEWLALKPGARLAIIHWTRLYGRLHIYMSPGASTAALGLPEAVLAGKQGMSLGRVGLMTWDGKLLPAKETVDRYWHDKEREKELTAGYTDQSGSKPNLKPGWGLLAALGMRSFAAWQVILFLVVFGILVGPVNLFVLAPPGRRHKLFITTPLLSLGASVLMVGIILLQDGIGGIGRRFIAINLEPGEATAYVTQEQASRTGVLMGSGFEQKQPVLIEPLALPDTPWVKLKNTYDSQTAQLRLTGREHGGNYFQSRAEQGQILRAAVSTRARVELKAGLAADAPPEIISALGFTVMNFSM